MLTKEQVKSNEEYLKWCLENGGQIIKTEYGHFLGMPEVDPCTEEQKQEYGKRLSGLIEEIRATINPTKERG